MPFPIEKALDRLAVEVVNYPVPVVDLIAVQTRDPYRVLVATILSARTRDEVTAKAAARLFEKAPNLEALETLPEEEIRKLIAPVGFAPSKAGYLKKLPGAIQALGGEIPDDIERLVTLPGVGRKTANLVVAVAFGKPAVCVDTHVHRITNIWGYVQTKTPLETEMALRAKLPERYWRQINSLLVAFGQGLCKPLRPACDICPLAGICPQLGVTPRRLPGKPRQASSREPLRLVSWNVNGIRAVEKKGFLDFVTGFAPDILALQEIKATPEQVPDSLRAIDGYHAFWFPAQRKGYAGVAVYTKIEPVAVQYGIGVEEHDREGRVLTLEFATFFLVNCYFPNAQHGLARLGYKLAFNRDLLAYLEGLKKEKSVVLCGDLNVAHQQIDLKNPKENENNAGFSLPEREWMDTLLAAGWIDTFRKFEPGPGHYTWWTYRFNARARDIGWRIDYFCVDQKSEDRVRGAAILKEVMGSDHCPVVLDFF